MAIIDQLYEYGGDLKMVDDAGNDIMDYAERNTADPDQENAVKKWLMINGFRPKNLQKAAGAASDKKKKPKDTAKKDKDTAKKKEDVKRSKSCSVM